MECLSDNKGEYFMGREFYKKIDKSFFDGKVTIPNDHIDDFIDRDEMNNNKHRDIKIKFKRRYYDGKFVFVHQSKGYLVLQVMYSKELCDLLKREFIQTYFVIESQKLLSKSKKFKTDLMGGNQEIVIFKYIDDGCIEFKPFVKIETPFDSIFQRMVELNVFGWLNKEDLNSRFITKYSGWKSIEELKDHTDTPYVVYYLVDEKNKHIYIGSAKKLGDRVKPGRKEIPEWNKFMYEVIHPDFHSHLKEIEYHSIMAFSKFYKNNGRRETLGLSDYILLNKDYKYYRD